eukprot:TRINITY_DN2721_c0_g1_i1.p3 TRINITY_DN2721_c0_g1~~TRINITY_DN2721_c0_g1_i1.p3  ORF type:complete len:160 (+),score=9.11 TRINITY_DN2721_c0_g1_i1:67-546(+)
MNTKLKDVEWNDIIMATPPEDIAPTARQLGVCILHPECVSAHDEAVCHRCGREADTSCLKTHLGEACTNHLPVPGMSYVCPWCSWSVAHGEEYLAVEDDEVLSGAARAKRALEAEPTYEIKRKKEDLRVVSTWRGSADSAEALNQRARELKKVRPLPRH